MTRLHVLIAALILVSAPLAGCLDEELIDDILGCMDENAENYDDNATSELVGDCIYMASMDTFMDAMNDVGSIEDMLEDTPKAGYSQTINVNEWSDDLGMQLDTRITETVMADLDNDAVHVHNFLSIAPLMTISYTHTQIGEVVNIHYTAGGMIAEGGESESYQTRDATPNVLEVLADQVGLFSGADPEDEGAGLPTPEDAMGSVDADEIPEDAVITITMSDDMESQTMTMEYTEDGAEITMTIHINPNEDLMSFTMASDNGSSITNIEYQVMWGDAVVIEVDETLPKTSIPIWFEEGLDDHDDHDDHGDDDHGDDDHGDDDHDDHHDDGNHISWDSYYDGYCEWEGYSDATDSGEDSRWWCKESQDDEEWNTWWYYCEHHDSDWHCTDDFGQSEEFEHSADWDEWSGSDDEDDDGPPTPEEAMGSVDANGDGLMSLQEFQDSWDSNEENPELDYDEVSIMFDDCDYDGSDLIDIDEMQCFIDGIVGMLPDGSGEECDAECFFHLMDGWLEEMDGHVTASEWAAFSNYSDDEDGEGMSEEDFEGLSGLIGMYDYDESGGLDWDEFQDVWSMINSDDDESDDHHDESDEHHHHGDGDYHHGHSGDDESTHADSDRHHDHHDDHDGGDDHDDHDDQHEMPAVITVYVAKNQTLNAPISDFEVRFLSDCDGEYDEENDEMVEPALSECTVEFSIPLTGGEANGVTGTYTDLDGGGLVSPGDMVTLEGWDGQTRIEMYDTWASEYTSDSLANPPDLPGFGAMLAVMTLLGAAFASRRD